MPGPETGCGEDRAADEFASLPYRFRERMTTPRARRTREPVADLRLTAWLYTCLDDDEERALDAIRPMAATSLRVGRRTRVGRCFAIVTVVLLIVVAVLGLVGKKRLAASKVAPEKAKAELQTTANELKEEITWGKPQQQPPAR